MRRLVCVFLAALVIAVFVRVGGHAFRTSAQENPTLYQAMLVFDLIDFTTAAGGSFGYSNYFKWYYATWRKSPDRTWSQKALFWDRGILYDATSPPREYSYPRHFE